MFTMLLSVIVYNHKLTPGQWLGTFVVFAGISVEALVKRKGVYFQRRHRTYPTIVIPDVHAKRVLQEKEKAKIKSL